MSSLSELQARRGQLIDEISTAEALRQSAVRAKFSAREKLDFGGNQMSAERRTQLQAQISQAQAQIDEQTRQLATLNAQLSEVDAQIAQLNSSSILPNQSTGQTVKEDQTARGETASPINPPPGPQVDENGRIVANKTSTATNAQKFEPTADAGTNDPTRTPQQTQSTPPITTRPGGIPANEEALKEAYWSQTIGTGAKKEDAASPGDNAVKTQLNQIFGRQKKIVAQPNPLDQYASYTYNISLYIMNPVEYKKMLATKNFNIAGWQLLMQSGGAPVSSGSQPPDPTAGVNADEANVYAQQILTSQGRNQFFPLDYYIDDLQLKSLVQGRGTRAAHNSYSATFKIYEPNGFTLFDRLYMASQLYTGQAAGKGIKNYLSQNYLMVIKFYGYDSAGNLVRPSQTLKTGPDTDSTAIIEKFFPFQFTGIKTRFQNKITEYDCEAISPGVMIGGGQYRGVIPYNVELTSVTVDQLLNGTAQFGATTAASDDSTRTAPASTTDNVDAKSRSASTQVQQSGWATANANAAKFAARQEAADAKMQAWYRGETTSTAANPPPVEAKPSVAAPAKADAAPRTLITGLVDALNKYQEDLCKSKTPGEEPTYTYPDRYEVIIKDEILKNAKVTSPGPPNKSLKPLTRAQTAGEAKLGSKQSVDNNAQNKSVLAGTTIVQLIEQVMRTSSYITDQQLYITESNGEIKPNGTPAETVGWFHIGMEAQPLEYDPKRNDYAYKIVYSISLYAITESKSDWFPDSVYRGTQKKYNYWFTGLNTQVLNFTQEMNALYYMVASGPTAEREVITDHREFDKRAFQPRSDESDQGNKGKTFEGAANLADSLYSPADTARARVSIIGDPDWIQQGEAVFGIPMQPKYGAILEDGSINYESQEPLFQMLWNKPVDYDLWTGLMDPGQTNFYANRPEGDGGEARVSNVYRCYHVVSMFSRGKFTQDIEGVQVFFQKKTAKKQSDTKRTPTASTGTPTLSGPTYTNFRRSEIAAQNAAAGKTAWATGYANALPTGARQDSMAAQLNAQAVTPNQSLGPAPAAGAPTSEGRVIGPAATPVTGTGGAAGTDVGKPVQVNVYLNNGQVIPVTGQTEINNLYTNKQITAQEASSATNRLRIWQNSANNPTTSNRSQIIAKENG